MTKQKGGGSQKSGSGDRVVYSEFGETASPALERAVPDLPPNQQNIRIQASRKGRKGKTVTVVTGFQVNPDKLTVLMKQLKAQCGAGGTIKDNEIEIQGDHTQKILDVMTKLGYKAKISGG